MKILQIIPDLPLAGAERVVETLSLGLKERDGVEVKVVSLYSTETPITENLKKNGVEVIFLGKKPGMDVRMISSLHKLFRSERPDVVHTHRHVCQYVIPAAVAAGVKGRVHTVHNIAPEETTPGVLSAIQSISFKKFSVVPVAISEIVLESIADYYNLEDEDIPLAYNGVDLRGHPRKAGYDIEAGEFKFLHIGRFMEQKNHVNLLKAFVMLARKYDNVQLHLVGEGEIFDKIDNMRMRFPETKVVMHGTDNAIRDSIHRYDAFMLPSLYEGMPITLIEAMSAAMPIIATPVGGVPDMITDGESGIFCDTDSKSIMDAMERMYLDKELRARLGENAYVASRRFSADRMTDEYLKIYEKVTG